MIEVLRKPTPFFFQHGPKAVILLHAFASNSNDMRMMARYLEKLDYTIYAPIFTGHATGEPQDIFLQGSPQQWWQDTLAAIDYVRSQGYAEIAIFGLSLGGIFATKAIESDRSLVGGGIFSSPIVTDTHNNVPTEFPKMADAIYNAQGIDEQAKEDKMAWLEQKLPGLLGDIKEFTNQVATDLDSIQAPFFIGQGGKDEMIDSKSGEQLRNRLTALNKQVVYHYYEDASHVITVNKAHHQLEEDVAAFLKEIY